MRFVRRAAWCVAWWAVAAAAEAEPAPDVPPAPAVDSAGTDSPGQGDLNEAIEAKLEVDELDDFGRVLSLCRKALDKGLDDDSRKFAEELYTGALVDRAAMLCSAIFEAPRPDPRWRQIRTMAMRDLDEAVGRTTEIGDVYLMIARLQSLPGGDEERAVAAATRAADLFAGDLRKQAEAVLVLADAADEPEEKGRLLDRAVDLAPRSVMARRARGQFRLVHDDFAGAREDLLAAAAEEPDDADVFEALGLACLMDERLDEARTAFDRAIDLDPEAPQPLLQRARVAAMEGDRERALADLERVLGLVPGNVMALLLRARVNQQAGDTDAALADVEEVLGEEPDQAAALELRGLIHAEREEYPSAIRDFRRLAAQSPDDATVVTQLGMLYLAAKQPREAIRRFTRALEIDDENFVARRGRSDAAISIGDHRAALDDLEKAVEMKPEDPGVLNNLSWLLATSPDDQIRDGGRAVRLALKACEVTNWKEPHIISTLAAGYAEQGDFETAKKYSRQAVDATTEVASMRDQLQKELASYEAAQPWRERQETPEDDAAAKPSAGTASDKARPVDAAKPNEAAKAEAPAAGGRERKPRRPFDDN